MGLSTAELAELKYALGYNLLEIGAVPYIGISALFERVIQPYLQEGDDTTSSTAVSAATTPTPVTLTLADATGFAAHDRVVIDVDTRQEEVTIQSVSGSTITVQLTKAHSGTYPVTVQGGLTIIRRLLKNFREIQDKIVAASGSAGLKKVDEIEWYGAMGGSLIGTPFGQLMEQLDMRSQEIAMALGTISYRTRRKAAGSTCAVY